MVFLVVLHVTARVGRLRRRSRSRYPLVVFLVLLPMYMCVCICFIGVLFYFIMYDKIAKIKEEFNILICSRCIIINLYVSCISNIR